MLEFSEPSDGQNSLELGLSQWKVQALTALKVGAAELRSMFFKVMQFQYNIMLDSFSSLELTVTYIILLNLFLSFLLGWWYPYSGKDLSIGKKQ